MSSLSLYLKLKNLANDQFVVSDDFLIYKDFKYQFEDIFTPDKDISSFVNDESCASSCSIFMGPTGSGKTTSMKQVLQLKLHQLRSLRMPVFISAIEITHNRYAVDLLESDPFHSKKEYVHTREFNTRKEKVDFETKYNTLIDKVFKARSTQKTKFNAESSRSCLIVSLYHNGKRFVYMDMVGNEKFDKNDPGANIFGNMSMSSITQILNGKKPQRSNSIISNLIFRKSSFDTDRSVKLMLIIDPHGDEDLIKSSLRNIAELTNHFKISDKENVEPESGRKTSIDFNHIPSLQPAPSVSLKESPGYTKPTIALTLSSPSVSRGNSPLRKRGRSLSPVKWKKQRLDIDGLSSSPIRVFEDQTSPSNSPPKILADISPIRRRLDGSPIRRRAENSSKFRISYKGKLETEIDQLKKVRGELDRENTKLKSEWLTLQEENTQISKTLENLNSSYTNLELEKKTSDETLQAQELHLLELREKVIQLQEEYHTDMSELGKEKESLELEFGEKLETQKDIIEKLHSDLSSHTLGHEEYKAEMISRLENLEKSHQEDTRLLLQQHSKEVLDLKSIHEKHIEKTTQDIHKLMEEQVLQYESKLKQQRDQLEALNLEHSTIVESMYLKHSALLESMNLKHSDEVESMSRQIQLINNEKDQLKHSHLSQIDSISKEHNSTTHSLKEQLVQLETDLSSKMEALIQEHNSKCNSLQQRIKVLEEQNTIQLENLHNKFNMEKGSLIEQLNAFQNEKDIHISELMESHTKKLELLQNQNAETESRVEQHLFLIKSLENDVLAKDQDISKLIDEKSQLFILNGDLEQKISQHDQLAASGKSEIDRLTNINSELSRDHSELKLCMEGLEKEIDSMNQEFENSKNTHEEKDILISSLECKIKEFEAIERQFESHKSDNECQISELQHENSELQSEIAKLEANKVMVEKELKDQQEININLREDVSSLLFEVDDSTVKNEEIILELKKNLLEKDAVISKISGQYKAEIAKINKNFEKERETLVKELEQAKTSSLHLNGNYSTFTSPLLANPSQGLQVDFLDQFTNFNDTLLLNHIPIYEDVPHNSPNEVEKDILVDGSSTSQPDNCMVEMSHISSNNNGVTTISENLPRLHALEQMEAAIPPKVLGESRANTLSPAFSDKKLASSLKENKIKNLIY